MLLQLSPNLRRPGPSSSPDWQVNWWETGERATSAALTHWWRQTEERVNEVCVQHTLLLSGRSTLGHATSVSWWCRVWETGRSPPPSWNLSYLVCWPEQEWPPSAGPKLVEDAYEAQFMQNTRKKKKSPKLRRRHTSSLVEYLKMRQRADSIWRETSSFCHGSRIMRVLLWKKHPRFMCKCDNISTHEIQVKL